MLNRLSTVFSRPAGTFRRPLFYARVTVFVAVAVVTAACQTRPPFDPAPARAVLRRAIVTVRPSQPLRAREIERLLALAEAAAAGEAATPWWEGSLGRTETAWLRATRAASVASHAVKTEREAARRRTAELFPRVQADLARARAEVREAGMGLNESAALARAETAAALAQRALREGDHVAAVRHIERSADHAAQVHRIWIVQHQRFSDPALLRQWRHWAEATIAASRTSGQSALLIDKLKRRVFILRAGKIAAAYPAELGANGLQRKARAGDRATPEGMYLVTQIKDSNRTRFYRALLINYPNDEDRMRFSLGRQRGSIPSRARIGNLIEIHGDGGHGKDWTDGCVALENSHMDRVFAVAYPGMPVTIVGTYDR